MISQIFEGITDIAIDERDDDITGQVVRRCWVCTKPIAKHDKWILRRDGRMQHRHCKFPDAYFTPSVYREIYGHEPY